jgi:chromosomal replication initiator protein
VNAKQIWQTALERLKAKVNRAVYITWFQGTTATAFQDGVLTVCVPTIFAKAHLESRFIDTVRSILADVAGGPIEVQFVIEKETPEQSGDVPEGNVLLGSDVPESNILPTRKRPYRIARARSSASQRVRHLADAASAAMNSTGTLFPVPNVRRSPEQPFPGDNPQPPAEEQPDEQYYQQPLPASPPLLPETLLNSRYTFNTFIVGKSNQLAHAAALAVAENPGRIYNPLFFYGGVGLGKTHLLHAIGHVGETTGLNVLYVTSEKFTNEIINAIRFQKTEEFRAKYRQIDILLVDDIQFIAGKESTEEEFFHTFNTLHNANKQIVVTSDRPPKAIHSLQDRLRSRFEWGLLADVQPPVYEHRLAILRSKAESLHFTIPSAVIDYVARPECSSVRELEGALNRVIAYATLHDAPLTVALAAEALAHLYSEKRPSSTLTVAEVLEGVSRYYNVASDLLRGKQRDRDIVWPRQVAMYLMREETNASLIQIGAELGGRDHTTIMHGWEKVHAEIAHNDRVRHEIAAVLESLQRR